jgi:hypothetical protein
MIKGQLKVSTELKIRGLIVKPLFLKPPSLEVKFWEVECDDVRFVSQFEVESNGTSHEIIEEAQRLHNHALAIAEGLYGILGGETNLTDQLLGDEAGMRIAASVGIAVARGARATLTITPQPADVAKYLCAPLDPVSLAMLELYRHILQSADPIAKFLGCYQLLDMAIDAGQDKIDDHIMHLQPQTLVSSKPPERITRKGNPDETIYTRLRNELMHIRKDSGRPRVSSTRDEVKRCLDNFHGIVSQTLQQRVRQSVSGF